jgi:hypothetical protein
LSSRGQNQYLQRLLEKIDPTFPNQIDIEPLFRNIGFSIAKSV